MKLPLVLTTLLLSASPAVADDFLYMVCKIEGQNTFTNLVSKDVADDNYVDYLMFEVDLSKSRFRNHRDPEWAQMSVEGNTIVQDTKYDREGFTARVRGVLPLNLPGPITIDNWFKTTAEYRVVKGKGDCKKSDSSAWKEINVGR